MITVAHIEVGAGDCTAGAGRRFGLLIFEVHFHRALAVLALAAFPLAVHKVITIAVHFTYRRLQIVQIGFDLAVTGVFIAVFAPALLPAL
ncbi:hypothetical protein D3C73_1249040 [compost metagenome]